MNRSSMSTTINPRKKGKGGKGATPTGAKTVTGGSKSSPTGPIRSMGNVTKGPTKS